MHRYVLILLALSLMTAGAAIPAAAQSSDSPLDGFFGDDDDDGDDGGFIESVGDAVDAVVGWVNGARNRVKRSVLGTAGLTSGVDAQTAADDLQRVANEHAATLQAYANNRTTADTVHDVFRIDFEVADETATKYVTADVSNGSYENASVVNSTDRSVDETCTLSGAAARNAASELEAFVDNYAEPGRDVDGQLISRVTAEYAGLVECSFWSG